MQERQQAELGEDYRNAIDQHDLAQINRIIKFRADSDKDYEPPLSSIMQRATMNDAPDTCIVSWCVEKASELGLTITDPRRLMTIVASTGAF
jgi:hypothetical protein